MIKSGRGSLKVGVVAKFFARFARNYTYNPTILKILDPPLLQALLEQNILTRQEFIEQKQRDRAALSGPLHRPYKRRFRSISVAVGRIGVPQVVR